ncbi:MAG: cysteine dioxygenase [Pseudomonadota bacterium]
MSRKDHRIKAIAKTMAGVRAIAADGPLDRPKLEVIRGELLALASQGDLFPAEDFPEAPPEVDDNCALYLLSQDEDGHFALYLQVINGDLDVPPHNHHTWAVIAGLSGCEENRFYDPLPEEPRETKRVSVTSGKAVALLPDDYHSIHLREPYPIASFHLYGLALELLPPRDFWNPKKERWDKIAPQDDIIDRRAG